MSNTLLPHGLQHAGLPCPSLSPSVSSNSCPVSCWYHPTISSSVAHFSSRCQSFPASSRVFSNKSALNTRWPKYWNFSFSISPSNEYSGLISFRMDWFDLQLLRVRHDIVTEEQQPPKILFNLFLMREPGNATDSKAKLKNGDIYKSEIWNKFAEGPKACFWEWEGPYRPSTRKKCMCISR